MQLFEATIRYIETLKIGQGRYAGQPFAVLPWQRKFIRGALAPGVGEAALSLGRGGGKSTLTAAIGCARAGWPVDGAGSGDPDSGVQPRTRTGDLPAYPPVPRPGDCQGPLPGGRYGQHVPDDKPGNRHAATGEGQRPEATPRRRACHDPCRRIGAMAPAPDRRKCWRRCARPPARYRTRGC